MSYYNIYTLENKSSLSLMNDAQVLWNYSLYGNGGQPPKIQKEYSDFYEFILISGEKKILILEDIINSSIINQVTGNNKSLLKKAYISNSCTSIESECFKDCSNLEYISYTNIENNATVALTTIDANAFENCTNLKECKLFNITNVPITTIGNDAFKLCSKLFEVQLENTQINSIGDYAFYECTNLVTIKFPTTLSSVGTSAFSGTTLVNIYFNGLLPASIGSNLFGNETPLNATCYYYDNYIYGSSLTSLKNRFPNNDGIVFIERNNNNIENRQTFYNITNNLDYPVDNSIITKAEEIIDSILIKRMDNIFYNIDLAYDYTLSGTNTLGTADWDKKEIRLNPDNTGENVYLNETSLSLNTVVLVHEILHIFGFGAGSLWKSYVSYDTKLAWYFNSKNGVYQYNKLIFSNGYNKKLDYISVEDSGFRGSILSHTEEGAFINYIEPGGFFFI